MPNNIGNTPLGLGLSTDFWGSVSSRLLVFAVVAGILAAVASGLSSWIGSAATSKVQDVAGTRITAAELALQKSREQTAALEALVAEANAREAEATLARAKIEAGLASRRLNSEQVAKIVTKLAATRDNLPSVSLTLLGDQEAATFGDDLARAIHTAGIAVNLTR